MNKRIKELYEQSRIGDSFGYSPDKFAELIVEECLNTLYNNGYDDAAVQLKEHFKE
jgi:hypothetical protein